MYCFMHFSPYRTSFTCGISRSALRCICSVVPHGDRILFPKQTCQFYQLHSCLYFDCKTNSVVWEKRPVLSFYCWIHGKGVYWYQFYRTCDLHSQVDTTTETSGRFIFIISCVHSEVFVKTLNSEHQTEHWSSNDKRAFFHRIWRVYLAALRVDFRNTKKTTTTKTGETVPVSLQKQENFWMRSLLC